MTKQQAFNKAVLGLLKQGKWSTRPGRKTYSSPRCKYFLRKKDGTVTKCAVGQLGTDRQAEGWEQFVSDNIGDGANTEALDKIGALKKLDPDFLSRLQVYVHDEPSAEGRFTPQRLARAARDFASAEGLTLPREVAKLLA